MYSIEIEREASQRQWIRSVTWGPSSKWVVAQTRMDQVNGRNRSSKDKIRIKANKRSVVKATASGRYEIESAGVSAVWQDHEMRWIHFGHDASWK